METEASFRMLFIGVLFAQGQQLERGSRQVCYDPFEVISPGVTEVQTWHLREIGLNLASGTVAPECSTSSRSQKMNDCMRHAEEVQTNGAMPSTGQQTSFVRCHEICISATPVLLH